MQSQKLRSFLSILSWLTEILPLGLKHMGQAPCSWYFSPWSVLSLEHQDAGLFLTLQSVCIFLLNKMELSTENGDENREKC